MTRYEYRILHLPCPPTDSLNQTYLNGEARLGWRLVAATAVEVKGRIGTRTESRLEQIVYMERAIEPEQK